jgi:hypothetical protein
MRFNATFLFAIFLVCFNLQSNISYGQNLVYGTISVANYGAVPNDGLDDTQAIRNAINAAVATNSPQIVLFQAGRYDLISAGSTPSFYLRLLNANNIILRGATLNNQPATKLVRQNSGIEDVVLPSILNIRLSNNITFENFILDNDPFYYTAGTVTAKTTTSVTVDVFIGHPLNIYKPYIMGVYDGDKGVNKKLRVTWETSLPTWSPVSGGSGRLLQLDFQALANEVTVGDEVFWFQGNHGGTQCVTSKSSNITFKNVVTHNSTGFVYHFVDNENITLNRVKIEPVGNRIAVAPRDGIHLAHNRGLILLDSVVVKNTPGDDGLNIHGLYIPVGSISSRTITFNGTSLVADMKPDSRIQFIDANFQPVWTGTIESSTPTVVNTGPVTVVFKETPPSWIVPGTLASPLGWIAKAVVIRNSVFENTGRFGVLARINNVVIDSSKFRFNGNAGIALGSNYDIHFQESQNAWNVVVKNSFFENNILRMGDNTGPGGVYIDQFFIENPNINGNLFLFNNTFFNETHAYNLKDAMNVHLWGNVYNNVTTPIWRNLTTTSNFTQSVAYNNIVTDNSYRNAIYYSETWPVSNNTLDTLGSVTWNNKTGSFAEFHFVGNHISYYARKGVQMGKVDVYLDGNLVLDDFDLYSNTAIPKSVIYTHNNLPNTVHTLRIENTGLKNLNATDTYINIDYLLHRMGNNIVLPTNSISILPIDLIDFYGKPALDGINLNWLTTNEVNNSHFEILKLDNNFNFNPIGKVSVKKELNSLNTYAFTDVKPNKGSNYYQLKQYDLDGKFSLSKIIEVNFDLKSSFVIYPNPAKVGETIKMTLLNTEGEIDIQLVDMYQRIVRRKTLNVQTNNLELNTSGLVPGVYILQLKTKQEQFVNKIIITPK